MLPLRLVVLLVLVVSVVLLVTAEGVRLPPDFQAVLAGVGFGIAAAIPTSLVLVVIQKKGVR